MLKPTYHKLRKPGARTAKCGIPLNKSDYLNVLGDEYTAYNYQNAISNNIPCANCYGLGEIARTTALVAKVMNVSDECPDCKGTVTFKFKINAKSKGICDTCDYNISI